MMHKAQESGTAGEALHSLGQTMRGALSDTAQSPASVTPSSTRGKKHSSMRVPEIRRACWWAANPTWPSILCQ